MLTTIQDALKHIKEVQTNVTQLNHSSMTMLSDSIFDSGIEICEDGYVALQHQDILTQQLNATSELLEMICKYIDESKDENLKKNIASALTVAKAKKEAFSGNAFEKKYEV